MRMTRKAIAAWRRLPPITRPSSVRKACCASTSAAPTDSDSAGVAHPGGIDPAVEDAVVKDRADQHAALVMRGGAGGRQQSAGIAERLLHAHRTAAIAADPQHLAGRLLLRIPGMADEGEAVHMHGGPEVAGRIAVDVVDAARHGQAAVADQRAAAGIARI